MLKTKRHFVIIGACLLVLSVIYICAALNSPIKPVPPNSKQVNLYFFNVITNSLERETRNIKIPNDNIELINSVLNELKAGPVNNSLYRTIPKDVVVKSANLIENENLFNMDISKEYLNMSPKDEIFCRASLVYTLTEFDFIDNVAFYIDGEPLASKLGRAIGVLSRANFAVNPDLAPTKTNTLTVTLYFANEDKKLQPELRTAEVGTNIEHYIVEQLIKGPYSEGLSPVLPADTKINGTSTVDNVCYVDLGAEFMKKSDSPETDALAVYSIVNSLTRLSNVAKVQILADSVRVSETKGGIDLSHPLEQNNAFISELIKQP